MYHVLRRGDGPQEFYWTIDDGSDTLAKSEMLSNWQDAWDIASRVKNYPLDFVYESFCSPIDKKWRWRIVGRNLRKVVSSTGKWVSESEADRERERVERAARYAVVADLTKPAPRR